MTFDVESKRAEILIIGGGIVGVSLLCELVSRGAAVRPIEAREDVGLVTSFAKGELLTPSMPERWNCAGIAKHLIAPIFMRRSGCAYGRFLA